MREELNRRLTRLPLAVGATLFLLRGTDALARDQTLMAWICLAIGALNLLAIVVLSRADGRSASTVHGLGAAVALLIAWRDAPTPTGRWLWLAIAALLVATAFWNARRSAPVTNL